MLFLHPLIKILPFLIRHFPLIIFSFFVKRLNELYLYCISFPEDELFLVAYPYFNVNAMLVVEELYNEAVADTSRQLIIFNRELDRIRSEYYPPFFYPKLATLTKTLLRKMETVYYIHNFKG